MTKQLSLFEVNNMLETSKGIWEVTASGLKDYPYTIVDRISGATWSVFKTYDEAIKEMYEVIPVFE